MKTKPLLFAAALIGAAASAALAQQPASPQPQTTRLRGVIEKVDGREILAKSTKGEELKLNLGDKALVVAVIKASIADIKPGMFIGRCRNPTVRRRRSKYTFLPNRCVAPARDLGPGTALPIPP